MIKTISVLAIALAIGFTFTGCKKQESTTVSDGQQVTVDTSSIEQKFQTAEPDVRADFDKAVAAVKGGNYTDGIDKLKSLASNAKLTPEQQQAVKDLIAKAQEALTKNADKAVEGASKAIDDVKKSLPQ